MKPRDKPTYRGEETRSRKLSEDLAGLELTYGLPNPQDIRTGANE